MVKIKKYYKGHIKATLKVLKNQKEKQKMKVIVLPRKINKWVIASLFMDRRFGSIVLTFYR